MVDGRDNTWRNRAPGPHAHRTTARQTMDACGQRCVDSKNSQMTPATTSTTSIRQLNPPPPQILYPGVRYLPDAQ